jgi:GAF domain-containing protein/nitrogen-specific signal transduction histidine kinase
LTRQVAHIEDMGADPDYAYPSLAQSSGQTVLGVPMLRDGASIGAINVQRRTKEPFTDKQIDLIKTFADQAVIAMENARLITETREALEQQTATAEILQVINSSPGDLAPVFDAILEKALRVCAASFGSVYARKDEGFERVTSRGLPPEYLAAVPGVSGPFSPGGLFERVIGGESLISIPDLAEPEVIRLTPRFEPLVRIAGARSFIAVALRKDEALLGTIHIYRQEVRPFSDKEIALLQNFAAQAVIAMENARLITETREALEQQTATAEVLQVINSSPGDLAPVFDAMLEKAMRLCEAQMGTLWTYDGEHMRAEALRGASPRFAEFLSRGPHRPSRGQQQLLDGARILHVADLGDSDDPLGHTAATLGGIRTFVAVPLRNEGAFLGTIGIYRQEVRPFTDKQIALLENFAAQAVIAMENARLITETREALEQQTATAEVLGVINSSPGDLAPVFDAMLERAHSLCGADTGALLTYDGECFWHVAWHGMSAPSAEASSAGIDPNVAPSFGRIVRGERLDHIHDMVEFAAQVSDDATRRRLGDLIETGVRTQLVVALRKDDVLLGAITANRKVMRPFTEKQIALLQNFAAQAVIAMENARLLTETREALEQQTATAEVLQVINSSPGDLAPVYDVILEKARSLCDVPIGGLMLYDGHLFRTVALHGLPEEFLDEALRPFAPGPPHERLISGERLLHEADYQAVSLPGRHPAARALVELGVRTTLVVPLRKDDKLLGFLAANRLEVKPFSEKEIALLENFAAQAVIAIDNARLLNEIRQRQAELRVTFDNMGDGVAMFDGELRLAAWNMNFQRILDLPDPLLAERPRVADFVRYLVTHGEYGAVDVEAEVLRLSERAGTQWSAERTRPDGRVIEVRSNPVPGGGVVLIYSDITERKRAEAEIRAARDTAERALQELQTAQASLVHAQKMAALGQLTAGIAHEIKNPLNFVNNFAELSGELLLELKETTAPAVAALGEDERAAVDEVVDMLRGNLDKIAEHGKRADGIVKSMLEHSRGVSGERRVVDLNALIEEALNLAYHGARAQDASFNITLERDFDRGLAPTELAPQEMTRVFLNLFGNGFYATAKRQRGGAGADFRPTLKVATRDLGDAVEVRVRDNGTGIAPDVRDKLFQPFVTTKPTGEGTGLGLSIAWDIVTQQHGGTITVDSQVGKFTEFTIRLPRV